MPTYAYACKDCGRAFDIHQAFSDNSLTVCSECGGVLRKKFNSVGVVFKGSGFYRNDSRSGGSDATASSSADAKSTPTSPPAATPASATPGTAAPATPATLKQSSSVAS